MQKIGQLQLLLLSFKSRAFTQCQWERKPPPKIAVGKVLKSSGAEKFNNAHVIKKASILDQAQHQKPGLKKGGAASPPTLLLNLVEITFRLSFAVTSPRLQFSPIKRFLGERGSGTSWEKLSLRCPRARSEMLVLNIGEFADSWVMTPRAGESNGSSRNITYGKQNILLGSSHLQAEQQQKSDWPSPLFSIKKQMD